MSGPAGLAKGPPSRWGPWLFGGWGRDVGAFGLPVALGLVIVVVAPRLPKTALVDAIAFLVLVIGVDVAHVYTTLFRTYFDRRELAQRPLLYGGVPVLCFAVALALHAVSHVWFWRVLAYLAVFHFVRQQAGWVALYRARAKRTDALGAWVDKGAVYAATVYPLLHWHAHMPRAFSWFVPGDFVDGAPLAPLVPVARVVWLGALAVYVIQAVVDARRSGSIEMGKHLVVGGTAIVWWVGIVATDSDLQFTATNVLAHGIPYFFLLYRYGVSRRNDDKTTIGSRVLAGGIVAFVGVVLAIAFFEEMIWDRAEWHSHPELFGGTVADVASPIFAAWLVPLLVVPQATHYVLDAFLWRRRDTSPAQARAIGYREVATDP